MLQLVIILILTAETNLFFTWLYKKYLHDSLILPNPLEPKFDGYVQIESYVMPLRDLDRDYLFIKDAIAKVKNRQHLVCMQQCIKDFFGKHGKSQYAIYLQLDLAEKVFEVLYSNP